MLEGSGLDCCCFYFFFLVFSFFFVFFFGVCLLVATAGPCRRCVGHNALPPFSLFFVFVFVLFAVCRIVVWMIGRVVFNVLEQLFVDALFADTIGVHMACLWSST